MRFLPALAPTLVVVTAHLASAQVLADLRDAVLPFATLLLATDVLTQHVNNARTGAVLDETRLTTANVNTASFGKLWHLYADGQVSAQPLYVSALQIDTTGNNNTPLVRGTFNAVIVATMHNTVYVYDADKAELNPDGRTRPLWAIWLGAPRLSGKDIDMHSTNDPEWGILGTPVVSPDKRTLYVVAWHGDGPDGTRFMLHALDLQKGTHRSPPVIIGAAANHPSKPCAVRGAVDPCKQKQRTALLLSNGVLYVAFGGDHRRGALFAFDASTLAQRAFWSSTPTGDSGGIWQSGQGPAADAAGNIYLMTGNGTFDANTAGGQNYANSFVKLKLQASGFSVLDYFTPCNFAFLDEHDLDLGSGGPVLVPGTPSRIVSGGKEGTLYVLSAANLGKHAPPTTPDCKNGNAVQEVHAFGVTVFGGKEHHGNIHGSPVFWQGPDTGWIYAWGENSHLKAYRFSAGKLQNVGSPKKSAFRPPNGMPGGMLALSANGRRAGTGILWAVVPLDGDANQQRGVSGIVLALDAQDVSRTLWTSEQFAQRDRLGLFAKFNPPLVAGGKVFVPTYGDTEPLRQYPENSRPTTFPGNYYVAVYGLLPEPTPARPVVNQDADDVTVVRAATAPLSLDTAQCERPDAGALDCTAALEQSAGVPAFHRVLLPADRPPAGCALLRVTTASEDAAILKTSGIGFWSAQATDGEQAAHDSGRFVTTGALRAVGTATLRDGRPATLHEFVGVSNCTLDGGGSLGRLFKPYMQFEGGADGKILRNWDRAQNYRIDGTTTQFDRSNDVLRP
jgi:hypothetical protein